MDDHYDSESASKGRRWTSRSALIVIVATAFVVPALAVAGKVADIGDLANYASKSSVAQPSSAPDLSRASKLVSTTLKTGEQLAVWQAPNAGGGACVFVDKASGSIPATTPTTITGAGECSSSAPSQKWTNLESPVSTNIDWAKSSGDESFEVIIEGRVDIARVASLAVVSPDGASPLAVSHGYFIGALPPSAAAGKLAADGPYLLVAYGRKGAEVSRQDLGKLIETTRPQ